ncbi:acetyl-CoA C-acetyltransferase [Luteitalea sp.]|jgi:acetyl-CoA C-acetyltransferase|uniref:acetyl-CoA C-acetyltransferase n=1 Tax=Luteitalea sp. TaxID=2004800 RepID=UPI0037C851A9
MHQRQAVIVSAVRTPTGKFLGGLKDFTAPQLGALAIREAVARAGVSPEDVDECILGNVVSAGLGQHPARQAALAAGLPVEVPALNVNMVCGSGLRAVMLAAQGIATGDRDIVVAGGMESMSQAPYLLPKAREGFRMGHGQVVDSMVQDGLWCAVDNWHMGMTGEAVAGKYGISREAQDGYAVRSHQKAAQAQREGAFTAEILPVSIPQKKGAPLVVDRDESVREDTSIEALAKLRPAFATDGTVTAGNAPGVNDGAAALVVVADDIAAERGLTVRARIVAQATSGLEPKWVMMTPVPAIRTVLEKADWTMESVDLFEINEAFSVQALAVTGELGIPESKVNVHGGAVALGHPIGASGARVLVTLLHALERRNLRRGVAALCLGGGNGVAIAIER